MKVEKIIHELERMRGYFPTEAVVAALEQMDVMRPILLRTLEEAATQPERIVEDDSYMAHIYAMYLLAQVREPAAYPRLIRIAALPDEIVEAVLDDNLTEGLPSILATVCGEDLDPMKSLIEQPECNEWARSAGLDAMRIRVLEGLLPREDFVAYCQHLLREGLDRNPHYVWTAVAHALCDVHPAECLDDLRLAYENGLVDPLSISLKEVEHANSLTREHVIEESKKLRSQGLMTDAVNSMNWWACFREDEEDRGPIAWLDAEASVPDEASSMTIVSPNRVDAGRIEPRRVPSKIGRNDPCPCGSGNKFKKCCG